MEEAFIGLESDRETSPIKSPSHQNIKRGFSKQFSQQTSVTGETSESTVAVKTQKQKVSLMPAHALNLALLLFCSSARGMGQGAQTSVYVPFAGT